MTVETGVFKLKNIAAAAGGEFSGDGEASVYGFTTDSRDAKNGFVFIAIKGEHSDGNNYVASALTNGAAAAIAQKVPDGLSDKVIKVEDTVAALGRLAAAYKRSLSLRTVAVTGSVGKTTTKEFIYSVLSEKYNTHKTDGNHNNELGLPLSVLTLDRKNEAAVYEMGMSARGEIAYLSDIVRPDVAVITNIGNMHIENLGSREAIRDAKMEITKGLSQGGALILNGDEPLLAGVAGAYYVSFDNPLSDIRISHIIEGDNGSAFDLVIHGERVESIVIPTFGRHNIFNAALAYAVGLHFGMGEFEIRRGLINFKSGDMRQQIYDIKNITIIKDCYNAGPESMEAAMNVLSSVSERRGKRAVAVLGEMKELGDFSENLHRLVGKIAARCGAQLLFTVGDGAKPVADSAVENGMDPAKVVHIPSDISYENAAHIISAYLHPGDIVLFKASRAMHLETLINEIGNIL